MLNEFSILFYSIGDVTVPYIEFVCLPHTGSPRDWCGWHSHTDTFSNISEKRIARKVFYITREKQI